MVTRVLAPAPTGQSPQGRTTLWLRFRPSGRVGLLVGLCWFGSAFLRPQIGPNLAAVDPFILLLVVVGTVSLVEHPSPAREAFARSAPFLWMIALGSLLGLFGPGLAGWALNSLARDLLAFPLLFATWHLLCRSPRALPFVTAAGIAATALVSVWVLAEGSVRGSGPFYNPNYAGHFLACSIPFLLALQRGYRWRLPLLVVTMVAVLRTGSFGSFVMVAAVFAYLNLSELRIGRSTARKARSVLILAAMGAFVLYGIVFLRGEMSDRGPVTVEQERFSRSSESRAALWREYVQLLPDHPLGVGPDGTISRPLFESTRERALGLHNDALSYLVERGPLGLIGLLGFGVVLWRRGPPGGLARQVLVAVLLAGLFHDTLHFRHLWIVLGVAFAADTLRAAPGPDTSKATAGGHPELSS